MRISARTLMATIIGAASLATAGTAVAQVARNDYSDPKTWLCKAGRAADACDVDLSTTIVKADGSLQREAFNANPAALAGGGGDLHAYLSASGRSIVGSAAEAPVWAKGKTVDTPLVSVPGLLSAQCVANEKGSYLEVAVHGDPNDPRADDINGDVMANGQVNASRGLHLIDVNEAMGNLIDIVAAQGKAFSAGAGKSQR